MNFKDLNEKQRIQMVGLLNAVIGILPEEEFVCHAIDHIEQEQCGVSEDYRYDQKVISTLRSEVLERLGGNISYMRHLAFIGAITYEQLGAMSYYERVSRRTLWLQGMINEVQQLNQEEGNN